jgi:hypothetical protein
MLLPAAPHANKASALTAGVPTEQRAAIMPQLSSWKPKQAATKLYHWALLLNAPHDVKASTPAAGDAGK